ncbi:GNAT family N-acetyltransferase [Herbaspirillum sp. HC18]|nr:GNAT family N-acetyltransferase [Herbaspirillum sp. HC18]
MPTRPLTSGWPMEPGQTSIAVYQNSIPAFIEPELDALYGHVFSSLPQFRVYGGLGQDIHTYLAQDGGRTKAALLFRQSGNRIQVLNEQIAMTASEIERFARYAFDAYPGADMVCFPAIRGNLDMLSLPHQHFYRTEDIVLTLPPTPDEYLAALGKATRKNFKYHGNRLKRNFPTLAFKVYIDGDIPDACVRDIIELNRARMATKNKESEIDAAESARLTRLVKESGLVSVMILDGRVVAGTVCSRVGANYFMHINAHDPAYDDARLGKLCCYMTICDCIERGGKEFHFMWGRFEYKYLLLGVQQDFDELIIYRSHARMLLNGATAVRTAFNGYSREWKFRLLDIADRPEDGGFMTRTVSRTLNFLRNVKQSGFRGAALRN